MDVDVDVDRRRWLKTAGAAMLAACGSVRGAEAGRSTQPSMVPLAKPLRRGADTVPVIGMGTWITFDVPPSDRIAMARRIDVLRRFFDHGGTVIDASPMYGHAEAVVGECLATLGVRERVFAASKIWTPFGALGPSQMANTEDLWGVRPMALMQVHNLLALDSHLPELREWQTAGRIRHLGVTTSHGRRHEELAGVIEQEPLDTVQLTYNIVDREAERRLLPMAAERGIGVIANRPFRRGALLDHVRGRPLPDIATALGCQSWSQFLLLFIVSHPALVCAIPATSDPEHMDENMGTLALDLPDAATREAMARAFP